MSAKLVKDFLAARRVGTPLVAITTPDPGATSDLLAEAVNGSGPVLIWNCVHGLRAFPGKKENADALREVGMDPITSANPIELLVQCETKLPAKTVVLMMNAHLAFKDHGTPFVQAVWNLRDMFKVNKRMLVMLGVSMTLPKELEQDVVALDEELPDADKLRTVVTRQHENAGLPKPADDVIERATAAIAGLASFPAEQAVAMSLSKELKRVDLSELWERKRRMIEQTPGLSVWRGGESFESIGGYENVKTFVRRLVAGPNRPNGIVFIDEIEKMMAGARGDNTGVSQGQHLALLTFMQDTKARGLLFVGHPGSGKSVVAKATGNAAGVPTIAFNAGDMKAGIVGESEALMRNALKVVQAVCQGRALFVATCNSLDGLSPELRRRFKNGTFFFDLPDDSERDTIWNIYLKKYGFEGKAKRPHDAGWTGAEIENCCDQAYSIGATLGEAATYIVPQAVAMAAAVERRRKEAEGAIISASYPGAYRGSAAAVNITADAARSTRRKIDLE